MRASLVTSVAVGCLAATGAAAAPKPVSRDRPAIVIVAFGTSVPEAQAALEHVDDRVRAAYPGREVRWAFTARTIVDKLRRRGQETLFARKVPLRTVDEAYADLLRDGWTRAVVQSLHVVPGQEYEEMKAVDPGGLRVADGEPLLRDDGAVARLAEILSRRFGGAGEVTVLCGHGNDRYSTYNEMLVKLDRIVRQRYPNVFVATVEGEPGSDRALADVRASGASRVRFVPVMIVAGDHIMNDVMGDEPESWKNRLGLEAAAEGGMGENDGVVDLYLERLAEAEARL